MLSRLQTASKRGRLAGYQQIEGPGLFRVAAHGQPFEGELIGTLGNGQISFEAPMLQRLPIVFAVILLLTVWPGVYFMDELVAQFVPSLWRPWVTYYWYIPITVIPLPWMWRGIMRKSRATIDASAREMIAKIAKELDAGLDGPGPA